MKTFFSGRKGCDGAVEKLPAILEDAGIDARRRGESLTLEEFIALGAAYTKAMR